MLALSLMARLVLSGVFLVAGVAKWNDRVGSRRSLVEFGLPTVLAKVFGVLLPICEVLVGICLLPASFAWVGAIGALVLLILFISGITVALIQGRKPDCHCFGQVHSKPIGWDLVVRNVALAAVAALVIGAGPRQPSYWAALRGSGQVPASSVLMVLSIALLILVVIQSWMIFQLIKQGGRILLRIDGLEKQLGASAAEEAPLARGLPVGEPAPAFDLPNVQGERVSLEQLQGNGQPVLLVFAHPGCGPCKALMPELAAWQQQAAAYLRLVIISGGSRDENLKEARQHRIETMLLQADHEVGTEYDALATPGAVLVRSDGTIGSAVATGAEAIRSLVSNTINEFVAGLIAEPLQQGATAPALVYPDLEGQIFDLSELRGKPAILLFWNPGCGFCQQMTEDLKLWEKRAAKAGTQVVLISTGTVEANARQGFRSPILLDQNFTAGKTFGVTGTPSALLLDEESRIASKVAVGRQEILDASFSLQALSAEKG